MNAESLNHTIKSFKFEKKLKTLIIVLKENIKI